jgi:hypothetical protein
MGAMHNFEIDASLTKMVDFRVNGRLDVRLCGSVAASW